MSPSSRACSAARAHVGSCAASCGQRRVGVHLRDPPVEAQVVGDRREAACFERRLEAPVRGQDRRGGLRPDAGRTGDVVGRVAAQRDEVRHLCGVDAVPLAHLGRPDPDERAAARGLEDSHAVADELERVAVGGGDEHGAVPARGGGREEVVRLVAVALRGREAERLDERGHGRELLEERLVEHATGLVGGEGLVPVGRRLERVPGDEHRRRLLGVPQPQQVVRDADERIGRPAARAADRLRERVVGAVREVVAVDREQRAGRAHAKHSPVSAPDFGETASSQ